jgi:hypothetical protein
VALTPAPRAATSVVVPTLIATNEAIYLGLIGRPSDGLPLGPGERARLKAELLPKVELWVVTAEGDAPLSRVREALALLAGAKGTVVLATPLSKAGRRATRSWSRYDHRVPATAKEACDPKTVGAVTGGPIGHYRLESLSKLNDVVLGAAKTCGDALPAGKGGEIHVQLRIKRDGKISQACAETDVLGEDSIRACVIESIKKLKVPAPDQKKGFVNFGVSVTFLGKRVKPLCDVP